MICLLGLLREMNASIRSAYRILKDLQMAEIDPDEMPHLVQTHKDYGGNTYEK
jgi:hypothetical protein